MGARLIKAGHGQLHAITWPHVVAPADLRDSGEPPTAGPRVAQNERRNLDQVGEYQDSRQNRKTREMRCENLERAWHLAHGYCAASVTVLAELGDGRA